MQDDLITLKEIAQKLDLPESTLRKYRDAYMKYIPYVGSGRGRRYRGISVEIFKTIRDLREEQRLSWEDTEGELRKRFAVDAKEEDSGEKVVVPDNEGAIRGIGEKLEETSDMIKKTGARQDFLLTTLAGEILKSGETFRIVETAISEMKSSVNTINSYNITLMTMVKNVQLNMKLLKEMSDRIENLYADTMKLPDYIDGKVNQIARDVRNELTKQDIRPAPGKDPVETQTAAPAQPPSANAGFEETFKIREELLAAKMELGKIKNLYEKTRQDLEQLRARKSGAIDEKLVEPVARKLESLSSSRGGKLVVRGR